MESPVKENVMDDFVTMEEAQRELGLSRPTFYRTLKAHDVQGYHRPGTGPRRWLRRADVARMLTPVPVKQYGVTAPRKPEPATV